MASFANVPRVRYPRSRIPMPYHRLQSMSVGKLYPFYVQEIYPGDSFQNKTNIVTRLTSEYLRPVMDNLDLDVYYFFVPNLDTFEKFYEVLGENKNSPWIQATPVTVPALTRESNTVSSKSVGDYLGLPVGNVPAGINILPFRAFAKIWDEWFRDENIDSPMDIETGDYRADEVLNNNAWSPSNYMGQLPYVARKHDYFSSCLPSPQKGPSVNIATSGYAPITPLGANAAGAKITDFGSGRIYLQTASTTAQNSVVGFGSAGSGSLRNIAVTSSGVSGVSINNQITGSNLYADLGSGIGLTVNDLRYAISLQSIYERLGRSGSRAPEYIFSSYGVSAPDLDLHRSEYLGGKRIPLSVQQVAQTVRTEEDDAGLGALGAFSLSNGQCGYSKAFTEHGFVIGVMCIRQHSHIYQQGIEKFWHRTDRFNYWDPAFAGIGDQPVFRSEIYGAASGSQIPDELDQTVFGYNEAFADLKYRPASVAGDMRSSSATSLDIWHFADDFGSAPTLNSQFIHETPANVDRTIAVPSTSMDQFIVDIYCEQSAVRVMPTYNVPAKLI